MFITLKASGAGRAAPMMEQVASRNASNGEDASQPLSRLSRRPACTSCQKRKLRCTGNMRDCDRCRTRAIPCVPSVSQQAKRSSALRSPDFQVSRRKQAQSIESVESGQDDSRPGSHIGSATQERDAADHEARNKFNNLFRNDFIDFSFSENIPDVPSMEMPTLEGNDLFMGFIDTMEPDALNNSVQSQAPFSGVATPSITTPATRSMTTTSSETGQFDSVPPVNNSHSSSPPGDPSPACSCMQNILRVVQRLDDDDFKLTALAFDQVVQLQKWIMSQCCKPLDCASCRTQSTALTIILIICDRLTEMFECIHKRLLRATYRVHEHENELSNGSQQSSSAATTPEDPGSATGTSGQKLYCTFTGGVAGNALCNPDLFSAEFQNLYSDEEQVHMIQALTRLQIRNFRGLLMRVDGASQGSGSVARRLKIEAMTARVTKAAENIEAVW